LTRTGKIRRAVVSERYADLLEALYGEAEELAVEADVRYADGNVFRMKTTVIIKDIKTLAEE
ncbi:MAG: hypothetical protein SV487_04580, partial [Thermodesulfobacteriota bacterium]|nr:hypothetical protein [Thermodesulfobacteriota bacterium]